MKSRIAIFGLLAVLLLVTSVGAWQEDFNGEIDNWVFYDYSSGGSSTGELAYNPEKDCLDIHMQVVGNHYYRRLGSIELMRTLSSSPTNYWAFTIKEWNAAGGFATVDTLAVKMYDINGDLLGTTGDLCYDGEVDTFSANDRVEIYRMSNNCSVYVNGVHCAYIGEIEGTVHNIGILLKSKGNYYGNVVPNLVIDMYLDDFVWAPSSPYLVSSMPANFSVVHDILDETNNGVYFPNGTRTDTNLMHSTWSLGSAITGEGDPTSSTWQIKTQHLATLEIYNTTSLNLSSNLAGTVEYNITTMLIDSGAPYGIYQQKLYKDLVIEDTSYFIYTAAGGEISWDQTPYNLGETASISWDMEGSGIFDTETYTYTGTISDIYGTQYDSWSIVTETGSHDEVLANNEYESGIYYALLWAEDSVTGTDYLIGFDIAEILDTASFEGITYDAETGSPLTSVALNWEQNSIWFNSTSDAGTGAYSKTGFEINAPIAIDATKTGYTFSDYNFTPLSAILNDGFDLYLIPAAPTYTTTAIGGLVTDANLHQAIEGATITIWNDTWSNTTTSSATGWYIFDADDGLESSTEYSINSTATSYGDSTDYDTTSGAATFVQQDMEQEGIYSLEVTCRYTASEALITDDVTLELSTGETTTTTNGVGTFSALAYGTYDITASCGEYTGTAEGVLVDSNTSTTMYLTTPDAGEGSGISYPPHNVRFEVHTFWGDPVQDVLVTATYIESSGPIDWLLDWLGISEDVDVEETELSGYTGSDGSITFMMVEVVKYEVTFEKEDVIDTSIEIYPKDDYYEIIAGGEGDNDWWGDEGYNINEQINTTVQVTAAAGEDEWNFNITYIDLLAGTSSGTVYLYNRTAGTDTYDNEVDSVAISSANFTHTFTITGDDDDRQYQVVFDINHAVFGEFERDYGITLKSQPLDTGYSSFINCCAALFIIFFTGLFFGATSREQGALLVCLEGWGLYLVGMLNYITSQVGDVTFVASLTFGTVIAVLALIVARKNQEGYN